MDVIGFRRNTSVCLLKQSLKCMMHKGGGRVGGWCSAGTGLKEKIKYTCLCLHLGISSYAETPLSLCHDDIFFLWSISKCGCVLGVRGVNNFFIHIHWSNTWEAEAEWSTVTVFYECNSVKGNWRARCRPQNQMVINKCTDMGCQQTQCYF